MPSISLKYTNSGTNDSNIGQSTIQKCAITGGAIFVGYGVRQWTREWLHKPYGKYFVEQTQNLSKNNNLAYKNAIDTVLTKTGLKNKGVHVVHVDENNAEQIICNMSNKKISTKKKVNNKVRKFLKYFTTTLEEKIKDNIESIAKGENAGYDAGTKEIRVNKDKSALMTFHEMGHALNYNDTGFKHILSKNKYQFTRLAHVILIVSLIKHKKQDNEEPKSFADKFTTFIKDNCGILTFGTMLPTIIEEGYASLNANKITKNVLSKDLRTKMNKFNAIAWGTYLSGAIALALGTKLAVWTKDKITELQRGY